MCQHWPDLTGGVRSRSRSDAPGLFRRISDNPCLDRMFSEPSTFRCEYVVRFPGWPTGVVGGQRCLHGRIRRPMVRGLWWRDIPIVNQPMNRLHHLLDRRQHRRESVQVGCGIARQRSWIRSPSGSKNLVDHRTVFQRKVDVTLSGNCLLYTSPSPRDS